MVPTRHSDVNTFLSKPGAEGREIIKINVGKQDEGREEKDVEKRKRGKKESMLSTSQK